MSRKRVEKSFLKLPLSEILPYENNPRINDDAVADVIQSIKQCENLDPIEIDENNVILSGHTRLKALQELGYTETEVIRYTGLSEAKKKKYRLLANKTAEKAKWDFKKLKVELKGMDFGGFDFGFKLNMVEDGKLQERHEENKEHERYADANILQLEKAQYDGAGEFDIPEILPTIGLPEITEWIGFNYMLSEPDPEGKGVHCFVNDYQFERLWNNPDKYIEKLSRFAAVASPDFSPYGDMPFCLQLFNHYRKHWVGRYLQENGVTIIPTIRQSTDERSKRFYLDGEPSGGSVIISSMWTNTEEEKQIFLDEYNEMFDRLHPDRVYLYGKILDGLRGNISRIPSFSESRWK